MECEILLGYTSPPLSGSSWRGGILHCSMAPNPVLTGFAFATFMSKSSNKMLHDNLISRQQALSTSLHVGNVKVCANVS